MADLDKRNDDDVPAKTVNSLHKKSDVDSSPQAQHHTLGPRGTQAASGIHTHLDGVSQPILTGVTITGAKAGNTALASVIAVLVAMGATDSTT